MLLSSNRVGAGETQITITPEPVRYAFVDGDEEKFRAHHWMKEGYIGGIENIAMDYVNPENEVSVSLEGNALIDNNDLEGVLTLKKTNWGFLRLDYGEFRKYYDGTGGVYKRFSTIRVNETGRKLELDIGRLALEAGLTFEKLPDLTFRYEREFKDGRKSRLTWSAVKEGAITKNIGPSWQEIDEIVDLFGIGLEHEIAGFEIRGEQKWEFVRSELSREEQSLSTTSVAADKKIRVQDQDPATDLMTTTLEVERWFRDERAHFSAGYRFAHLDNQEMENIFELNESRTPFNFANPKQVRNARADNDFDTHTWVGSFQLFPQESLSFITRMKSEVLRRESNSTYPQDTTANTPDGIINNTERSVNDSKALRLGEGVSIRYTGIPQVALYNDFEFEQIRLMLREDRKSLAGQSAPNANEIFSRETLVNTLRGSWTLGGRAAPWDFLDLTSQVRYRRNNNDYDDRAETDPGANTARSAFVDWENIHTNEFTTRAAFKFWREFQPSFRYQFRDDDYISRFESEISSVKTQMTSNIYTFDVVMQAAENLLTTVSYSYQDAVTTTPARLSNTTSQTPAFNADVGTWLFSADYAVNPKTTVSGTVVYSRADNFNDFSNIGLPLGADYDQVDLTLGFQWTPTKNLSIEPKYSLYLYRPNQDVEFGDYHAHLIWLDFSFAWA